MLQNTLFKLSCMLMLLLGINTVSYAVAETEFNNTWDFANTINLGATGTGTCTATGDIDWWRVTSATDGKLTVNWSATNSLNVYCQIYDTLGVLQFASAFTSGSNAVNVDGLTAGTYYIRFFAYNAAQSPTYSFVPTWTTPVQANDVEQNGTRNQAKTLALNSTTTGHIGYYYNNLDDTLDWWKVTTNLDGQLSYTITSHNGANIYAELFDNNGTTYFAGSYTSSAATFSKDGLSVGTYYIRIRNYSIGEFAPYTLSNNLILPPVATDAEQNGTRNTAINLPLNGSKSGHIGYYYNNLDDTLDWYKVTTNLDGKLNFTIASLNGANVYAELFDNDGTTFLTGSYTSTTATYSQDGLSAGTYYIRIRNYSIGEFAPYTLSNTLTLPPVANDIEPNGTYPQALTFNLGDSVKGHIGYYYNHLDDTLDWYKVTTTLDGRLSFYMQTLNGQNVYIELFDGNGTTYLGGGYTSSANTWNVDGLSAGTYYFRIKTYYQYEFDPYKFIVNLITPSQTIDVEPNGTRATAVTMGKNDSISGHVGYYYNNLRDTFDYRKIVINEYGNLTWTVRSTNNQNIYAQLLDNNGTTVLAGSYTSSVNTYSRNDLAPGTYYLLMHTYYINSEFVPYSLKTVFTPVIGTDIEPNATLATATAIPLNTNFYGCFGYFYNGSRDTNDWLKVVTPDDGKIVFTATNGFANTSNIFLEVYDANGVSQFSQYTGTGSVLTYTKANIRKGTYYIKVRGYYTSDYSQYLLNLTFTSTNATDAESNNTAALSKMIAGYTTRNGNIGYNGFGTNTDTVDWHKVRSWGVGTMNLTFQKVANPDGGKPSINYQFYSDPNAGPIYNSDLVNDTTPVSYTLPAGVYYIKLTQLASTYGGYKIVADYRDTCSLQIAVLTQLSDTGCGKGTLEYNVTRGVSPYDVQLYKDGVAYGAPIFTNGTASFTTLDAGVYYASAKSSIATECSKETGVRAIIGVPVNPIKLSFTSTTAIVRWDKMTCADGFIVAYRNANDVAFLYDTIPALTYRDTLTGLLPNNVYKFKVAAFTDYNGIRYMSDYTAQVRIKTPLRIGDEISESESLQVYPNPTTDKLNIVLNDGSAVLNISIINTLGQQVKAINNATDLTQAVDVSSLQKGIYFVSVTTATNTYTSRFIKE